MRQLHDSALHIVITFADNLSLRCLQICGALVDEDLPPTTTRCNKLRSASDDGLRSELLPEVANQSMTFVSGTANTTSNFVGCSMHHTSRTVSCGLNPRISLVLLIFQTIQGDAVIDHK